MNCLSQAAISESLTQIEAAVQAHELQIATLELRVCRFSTAPENRTEKHHGGTVQLEIRLTHALFHPQSS